jgi:thiol-disulfide isomerase/thioredoxin
MPLVETLRARYQKLRERRAFRWGLDALFLVAVVLAVGLWQTRGLLDRGTPVELTLATLDGAPVSLAALRGKPVLVSLWAPWCGVCKTLSPNVSRVRRWVGDRAHVVSVAAAYDDVAEVKRFAQSHGVDYPVLLGGDAELRAFKVSAFPTLYFLDDAEGRVSGSAVGYTTTVGLWLRLLL